MTCHKSSLSEMVSLPAIDRNFWGHYIPFHNFESLHCRSVFILFNDWSDTVLLPVIQTISHSNYYFWSSYELHLTPQIQWIPNEIIFNKIPWVFTIDLKNVIKNVTYSRIRHSYLMPSVCHALLYYGARERVLLIEFTFQLSGTDKKQGNRQLITIVIYRVIICWKDWKRGIFRYDNYGRVSGGVK